jgi:hypothetical protein
MDGDTFELEFSRSRLQRRDTTSGPDDEALDGVIVPAFAFTTLH